MAKQFNNKWGFFEVAARTEDGASIRFGVEAPNARHAIGMVMDDELELVHVKPESKFNEYDKGYWGRA